MLRAQFLVDVCAEGFAPRAPRSSLRHRGTRRIEPAERQNIDLSEEIYRRTPDELLLENVLGHPQRISTGAVLQSIRPPVVGCAVASIAEWTEILAVGRRP